MNVDYAMLVKLYGDSPEAEKRHSPAQCIGCKSTVVVGNPNPAQISTSFAERQNLSVRMGIRRYTRLTNAFSRKIENHAAAVALYYLAYNFIKIHRTLRVTNRVWEVSNLVALLEAEERGLERAARGSTMKSMPQTYGAKIDRLTAEAQADCERCDKPARWDCSSRYQGAKGESAHFEKLCDKHAKDFATQSNLQFPPPDSK